MEVIFSTENYATEICQSHFIDDTVRIVTGAYLYSKRLRGVEFTS